MSVKRMAIPTGGGDAPGFNAVIRTCILDRQRSRTVVLGHLLRGETHTSFDRLLSLRFGAASVCALDHGQSGIMAVLDPPTVNYMPLDQGTQHMKTVPLDCDTILTARDLGISFGN